MSVVVPIALSVLLVGCVIPPSLSVENQDAGINSPPAITAVRAEDKVLVEADPKNPATFVRGEGTLNIALLDTDLADTLYVRVFVDYTPANPEAARSECKAAPNESSRRNVTCDVGAVCFDRDVTSGATLNMTVMAFDREPLDAGDPPHQAMPEGGLSTSRFFFLTCEGAST